MWLDNLRNWTQLSVDQYCFDSTQELTEKGGRLNHLFVHPTTLRVRSSLTNQVIDSKLKAVCETGTTWEGLG